MNEIIKLLSELSVNNDDFEDITLLCNKINLMNIDDVDENKPEIINKMVINFFEILSKRKKCLLNNNKEISKWIF